MINKNIQLIIDGCRDSLISELLITADEWWGGAPVAVEVQLASETVESVNITDDNVIEVTTLVHRTGNRETYTLDMYTLDEIIEIIEAL